MPNTPKTLTGLIARVAVLLRRQIRHLRAPDRLVVAKRLRELRQQRDVALARRDKNAAKDARTRIEIVRAWRRIQTPKRPS